jgi:NDP-sugar pyrophosphorylase family protein
MKALLICPNKRSAVGALNEIAPLATIPLLGKSLIEYWAEHLVRLGAKELLVVTSDRAQNVREIVGNGERWGVRAQVIEETRELNPSQARLKYQPIKQNDWLAEPSDVTVLDHFPSLPECPLFSSYADLFTGLQLFLPRAKSTDRIGLRELQPGIWAGLHAHVAPEARLLAPCWLGDNVWIGANAVVGPMAILENRVCVENGAEISESVIATDTFVGALTEIRNSFACGNTLINWKTGISVKVPDAFVLSALRAPQGEQTGWLEAVRAIYAGSKEDLQSFLRQVLLRKGTLETNETPVSQREIRNQ